MVSPLKTWQHSEPQGLWPALGGLAVVAHVGILGLSLPYMMQLMQPAGLPTAVVPIELIDVDSAEPIASAPAESSAEPSSSEPSPTEPLPTEPSLTESSPTEPLAESSAAIVESQNDDTVPVETSSPEPDTPSPEADSQRPNPAESPTDKTDSLSGATEPSPPSTETTPPATDNLSESSQTEEPSAAQPGDQPLPLPEDSTGENAAAKTAYISVVNHSYVPAELLADVADTPPELDYGAVTSLTAAPQDLGCGEVDFSQRQVTYRAVVSPEGTLQAAIPWTGSIEPQSLSEDERAIACLLIAAGFSFTPAFTEGTAVANDSLLLTIDIVESK